MGPFSLIVLVVGDVSWERRLEMAQDKRLGIPRAVKQALHTELAGTEEVDTKKGKSGKAVDPYPTEQVYWSLGSSHPDKWAAMERFVKECRYYQVSFFL